MRWGELTHRYAMSCLVTANQYDDRGEPIPADRVILWLTTITEWLDSDRVDHEKRGVL